jgi:hypothetical protein
MTMPSSRDFRPQTKPALLNGKKQRAASALPRQTSRANGTRRLTGVNPRSGAQKPFIQARFS